MISEYGPWLVRVQETKFAIGVFTCLIEDLYNLIDEDYQPDECEFTQLAPGGLIFQNCIILDEFDPEEEHAGFMQISPTEEMSMGMFVKHEHWQPVGSWESR